MSSIAIAAAGDESDGDWIGKVKEFPELEVVGKTKNLVLEKVKLQLNKIIKERRAQGEKIPAGKLKFTVTIKKK